MSLLSPKRVAKALGVSESSLKRWCDAGTISSARTTGGHRRLQLGDVLAFVRASGRTLAQPELLGLPPALGSGERGLAVGVRLLTAALLEGSRLRCRQVLYELFLAGHSWAEIGDRVIAVSFTHIGDQWARGELNIYRERRACEVCQAALLELIDTVPAPTPEAPLALGASPAGDPYVLPGRLVDLVLRQAGFRTMPLGTGLPLDSLAAAILEHRPRLAWLSVSHLADESHFLANYAEMWNQIRLVCPLVIGGRALHAHLRRQLSFTACCDQLHHLESFVVSLPNR